MSYTVKVINNETGKEEVCAETNCLLLTFHKGKEHECQNIITLNGEGGLMVDVIGSAVDGAVRASQSVAGDDIIFKLAVLKQFSGLINADKDRAEEQQNEG